MTPRHTAPTRRLRLGTLVLAGLLLAGCGAAPSGAPTGARVQAGSPMAARAVGLDEISAAVENACATVRASNQLAALAVLQYPSDAGLQRALLNVLAANTPKAVAQLDPEVDESFQALQTAQFFKRVPEVTDPVVVGYVRGIADRLARAAGEKPFAIRVADVPVSDAFNAGGHAMVLYTGLLISAKDESEVAGVIAHEMTHGLKRHVMANWINLSSARDVSSAAYRLPDYEPTAADAALWQATLPTFSPEQRADVDFVAAYFQGKVGPAMMRCVTLGFNANFAVLASSRQFEAEADAGGVRLAAAAGYDPQGHVRLMDRHNVLVQADPRYANHPQLGSRVAALRAQIANERLKGTDRGRDRLAAVVAHLKAAVQASSAAPPTKPAHAAGAGCLVEDAATDWTAMVPGVQR